MFFFLAVFGFGHGQATEMVGAHVHTEKMSGSHGSDCAIRGYVLRIEARGFVIVAVNGVNVPAIEFAALGKRICDMLFHGIGDQVIERSDVLKTSPAFERLKKMARFDFGHILVGVVLEEFLPGDRTAQATHYAELAIVEIRDSGAVVLTR